ncbi:MAG TPA: pilus assembly protein PilM, partial [Dehalococcoidales bacterium]|nr:pilus assembly protein PilM [Dehalococcoidales bacterium]
MTKHSVSLYIDESVIRLLVSDRKGVRVCASVELEPNLINSMVVADKPKLASRISQLLKNHEIKTGSLDLVISASQVLTRPILLPALPKNLLHEAVVREAKRVLPLSLDQVYLSYQSAPAHNGKMRVFLAALRRESVDSIIDTMKIAKIKVASLTIKPLAIARLVKTDGIIVDVRKNEF